jgi:hypothetical protein
MLIHQCYNIEGPTRGELHDRMPVRPDVPLGLRQIPDCHRTQIQADLVFEQRFPSLIKSPAQRSERRGIIIEVDLMPLSPGAKSFAATQRSTDLGKVMLEAAAAVDGCSARDPVLWPAKQPPPCVLHQASIHDDYWDRWHCQARASRERRPPACKSRYPSVSRTLTRATDCP